MLGSLEASRKKFGTTPKRSLTLSSSNWFMQHHPFFHPDARATVRAIARMLILARRAALSSPGRLQCLTLVYSLSKQLDYFASVEQRNNQVESSLGRRRARRCGGRQRHRHFPGGTSWHHCHLDRAAFRGDIRWQSADA